MSGFGISCADLPVEVPVHDEELEKYFQNNRRVGLKAGVHHFAPVHGGSRLCHEVIRYSV